MKSNSILVQNLVPQPLPQNLYIAINPLQGTVESQKEQIASLQNQMEQQRQIYQNLLNQNNLISQKYNSLLVQTESKLSDERRIQERNTQLQIIQEQKDRELQDLETRNAQLQSRLLESESLNRQSSAQETEIWNQQQINKNLENKNKVLTIENQDFKFKIDQQNESQRVMQNYQSLYNQTLTELESTKERMNDQSKNYNERIQNLLQEIDNLTKNAYQLKNSQMNHVPTESEKEKYLKIINEQKNYIEKIENDLKDQYSLFQYRSKVPGLNRPTTPIIPLKNSHLSNNNLQTSNISNPISHVQLNSISAQNVQNGQNKNQVEDLYNKYMTQDFSQQNQEENTK